MPKRINTNNINQIRQRILAKGFCTRAETGEYIGVSQRKGRDIYDQLSENLKAKGIEVHGFGISINVLNDYIGLTTDQILDFAKKGM